MLLQSRWLTWKLRTWPRGQLSLQVLRGMLVTPGPLVHRVMFISSDSLQRIINAIEAITIDRHLIHRYNLLVKKIRNYRPIKIISSKINWKKIKKKKLANDKKLIERLVSYRKIISYKSNCNVLSFSQLRGQHSVTIVNSIDWFIGYSHFLPGSNGRVIEASVLVSLILINVVEAKGIPVGVEPNFRSLPSCGKIREGRKVEWLIYSTCQAKPCI